MSLGFSGLANPRSPTLKTGRYGSGPGGSVLDPSMINAVHFSEFAPAGTFCIAAESDSLLNSSR